jgi:hypothetical protein
MHWIYTLLFILLFNGCALKNEFVLKTYGQSLPKLTLQTPFLNKPNPQDYTKHYFSPWNKALHVNKFEAMWPWRVYKPANKYFGETLLPRTNKWFKKQLQNAQLDKIGSVGKNAIILKQTDVKVFPTNLPLFANPKDAGEGFPFDYNQNSQIKAFSPVWLSHYSLDGMWAFIEADSFFGWVEAQSVTTLTKESESKIVNAPKVVAVKPSFLTDPRGIYTKISVGTIMPLENGSVFTFLPNNSKITFPLDNFSTKAWPIPFNKNSIDEIGSLFINEPYGWGGLFGHRDCSSMTKDFFAPFGIWLPRNSKAQFEQGSKIYLKGLSIKEKERMIAQFATPFLSLIYLPGHIMLYTGNLDKTPTVMHNTWGIKTVSNNKEGRFIIGKTILSDLHLGSNHPQADKKATLLSRIEGISTIDPLLPKERLLQAYPKGIKDISDNVVTFYNGKTLPFSTQKSYNIDNILDNVDIQGQFIFTYPTLAPLTTPTQDPGRLRNDEFFKALYGETKEEIEKQLVPVKWLPSHTNKTLLFHSKHGAAKALERVSNQLDKLPPKLLDYVLNPAGTYNYRKIAGTSRLSMHSYGIAIDISTKYGDYWRWSKDKKYKNQIPKEIVDIFESNGFIWGGRWKHFDTFHFEYRPELTLP